MAASSEASTGDEGLIAQMDAVEEAAALLTSRHDECYSSELGFDFTTLEMRPHHESRPLWVTPTGRIFLEAYSDLYEQARDFLVAICEPKSRPQFIHEYALDRHALFAAASMGMTGSMICEAMDKFSKCVVADGVKAFVRACTSGYGKVKLVLHRSRFYVESPYTALLKRVASNPVVHACRVMPTASSLAAARIDKDGFLIGEAKLEGSDSVGLQGVIGGYAAASSSAAAAAAGSGRFGGSTVSRGGARMSSRVTGEVNEEEEGDNDDDDDDEERQAAPGTTGARAGAGGAAGPTRMAPAEAVPQATEQLGELTDDELLALVDEAEARWASSRPAEPVWSAADKAMRPGKRVRDAAPEPTPAEEPAQDDAPDGSAGSGSEPSAETRGTVLRFEIRGDKVDVVRAACAKMHPPLPLMLEYDFREDRIGVPTLAMELTRPEGLRPYQSRSLAKMFGNGRARSGMIVLPCGAGKTLVGIAAACTIKKSTIVLCPNETSINQWVDSFVKFSTFGRSPDAVIRKLTASAREPLPPPSEAVILLTTYSMIGMRNSSNAAAETVARLREIESREWGLMLLDETHQVVANTFRRVLFLSAHCRLGLTATVSGALPCTSIAPSLLKSAPHCCLKADSVCRAACSGRWPRS
jgi:DNA excision repair protein ERCC-3